MSVELLPHFGVGDGIHGRTGAILRARFESVILHGITAVVKKGHVDCGDKLVTIEEDRMRQNSQEETCRRCVVTDKCASIPRTCRAVASY